MVHAFYRQPGGEDRSFREEAGLLERNGVEVETFTMDNDEIASWSAAEKAAGLVWNRRIRRQVSEVIGRFAPDVVHVQNVFPGLSPSVYAAAGAAGVPVVQKLSNFRPMCVNGLLFREGKVCHDCLHSKVAWRGAARGCFRGSRPMSTAVALSQGLHRILGTWSRRVQAFIALDEHGRSVYIEAGFPAERIHVKPNFLDPFPAVGAGDGGYALFVGRIAPGKGVETLVRAWTSDLPPLKVVGDGPLLGKVTGVAGDHIEFLGRRAPDEVRKLMGRAVLQVVPSEFDEPFGRTALEAMGVGTPVLASMAGALSGVVRDGVSGAHFETGSADALRAAAKALLADSGTLPALRPTTRRDAIARFSGPENFRILMDIYRKAGVPAPAFADAA